MATHALIRVTPVQIPSQSAVTGLYKPTSLADAFAIPLPPDATHDRGELARFIVSNQPGWVGVLMNVRDAIVAVFGLKAARHLTSLRGGADGGRIALFKIYSASKTEIVMGEDDKHLDFRISVLCAAEAGTRPGRKLTVSTVVQCRNRLGRAYIRVIDPFHRWVVQASLRRAARQGWPKANHDGS